MAIGRLSTLNAGLPNLCSPDDTLTKLLPELIYGQWGYGAVGDPARRGLKDRPNTPVEQRNRRMPSQTWKVRC